MARYELLNNVAHQDLCVITQRSAELGDAVGGCVVYPTEFNELQKYYPILFQQSEDGFWLTIALFGFEANENLFLTGNQWRVPYIPAVIEREPFVIGMQQRSNGNIEPVVHVDLDSPRIAQNGQGERLFLTYGGNSPYLERITAVLSTVHEGVAEAERMLVEFVRLDLIETITLEIEFPNGVHYKNSRYATISKEKLLKLPDAEVVSLHRSGLLRYAYMIIGSITNIQQLVDIKNEQLR
ncbi:SapC family protein [Cellvibrio sp. NN19]|uniref:SapC family protein n=1 Tax=Cellvibrio chitinivorans TaxID=3102792 RepID=UPI002B406D1D|nr:SapC family protein [Cellvibrio sp. NN19]